MIPYIDVTGTRFLKTFRLLISLIFLSESSNEFRFQILNIIII